jgi:hypothetical protein
MKNLSDEELIDIIDCFGFDKGTYIELKYRLERGRKAVKAINKLIKNYEGFLISDVCGEYESLGCFDELEKIITEYQQSEKAEAENAALRARLREEMSKSTMYK